MKKNRSKSTLNVLTEDSLTIASASVESKEWFGKSVDRSTIYRWIFSGVRGVKLEHARIGNRIVTSRQALHRFFTHLTEKSA
ncbi:DUF1580 domain-containing protein [Roseiconus lacunae]|uniref:DUF1580 domain-containing protein n=1 Tax=Roseiconus lacunae TaxID=2605694 RepID=UPI001E615393|nr:DUF1580 domain-containing protein [Roseiconus lacunae]MCD0458659.1 DUF1580 domain-containing protein [Roseiconus lacunae]